MSALSAPVGVAQRALTALGAPPATATSPLALGIFGAGVAGALVGGAALLGAMISRGKFQDHVPAILAASLAAAVVGGVMLSRSAAQPSA